MTDEERQQLENLEKNLTTTHAVLQGQIVEAHRQVDNLTAEGYRTEGALRLIQTLKAFATASTPAPVRQKEKKNETLPMHPSGGLPSAG